MKRRLFLSAAFLGAGLAIGGAVSGALPAFAGEAPIYTGFLSNKAVGGYDPVSYFTDGTPVEGKSEYTLEYKGAEWFFASAENLEAFRKNPERYAPQYGGYCAWAMAQGQTAKGDPHYWKIVDGKLYLNYSASIQNAWDQDIPGFIKSADTYWPGVIE